MAIAINKSLEEIAVEQILKINYEVIINRFDMPDFVVDDLSISSYYSVRHDEYVVAVTAIDFKTGREEMISFVLDGIHLHEKIT